MPNTDTILNFLTAQNLNNKFQEKCGAWILDSKKYIKGFSSKIF